MTTIESPEETLTELRVTEAVVRVVVLSPPTGPDTKGTWQCPPTAEEEMGEDPQPSCGGGGGQRRVRSARYATVWTATSPRAASAGRCAGFLRPPPTL
ncbi:hypothetical protein C0Q70_19321 [Pomacea canaliculata]|uniref:Uncharacterized protein n=1 Tax=Pomacea canaliculata TaxID=400727 RepID=A0A2T7NJ15_POMCA|nr:hypothetical protein C0Q70_19321 [Pomacea canaliculata]